MALGGLRSLATLVGWQSRPGTSPLVRPTEQGGGERPFLGRKDGDKALRWPETAPGAWLMFGCSGRPAPVAFGVWNCNRRIGGGAQLCLVARTCPWSHRPCRPLALPIAGRAPILLETRSAPPPPGSLPTQLQTKPPSSFLFKESLCPRADVTVPIQRAPCLWSPGQQPGPLTLKQHPSPTPHVWLCSLGTF